MTYSKHPKNSDESVFFGKEKVDIHEKQTRIQKLFDRVSSRYDIMNDAMSLGLHRLWKRHFVDRLHLPHQAQILDLACGTGDIGRLISRTFRYKSPHIIMGDFSYAMLEKNRSLTLDEGFSLSNFSWVNTQAEHLPFDDASFDIVTLCFGLRNFGDQKAALKDIQRILKPHGKLYCMEFSQPENPYVAAVSKKYNQFILPCLGKILANNSQDYQYLSDSIETFPDAPTLSNYFQEADFEDVSYSTLAGGVVAIHVGKSSL